MSSTNQVRSLDAYQATARRCNCSPTPRTPTVFAGKLEGSFYNHFASKKAQSRLAKCVMSRPIMEQDERWAGFRDLYGFGTKRVSVYLSVQVTYPLMLIEVRSSDQV